VTCKFCNQSFSKQPILDQHILTKHPGAEEYLKVCSNPFFFFFSAYYLLL